MFRKLFNNRIITIISIITNIMMVMTMFSPDELADMAIHSESDSVRDELSSGIRFEIMISIITINTMSSGIRFDNGYHYYHNYII